VVIWLLDEFLDFQSVRIDLHDIRSLRTRRRASLTGAEQRAIRRPADVIDAKPERNAIAFRRRLTARKAEERLASPRGNVEPFAILRNFQPVCSGGFASRNDLPSRAGVPFPDLAVIF